MACFPGAITGGFGRAVVIVDGSRDSPKHITATLALRAVQLVVPFASVASRVCATGPVCGAESRGPLTASARDAWAAFTGVLRTLTTTVAPGGTPLRRNCTAASASSPGATTCGNDATLRARVTEPPLAVVAVAVTSSTRAARDPAFWINTATRSSTAADVAAAATPVTGASAGSTLPTGAPALAA